MLKNILIITAIIVALIAIGATAYINLRRASYQDQEGTGQGGGEVTRQEEVATAPEEPVVQPEEPTTTEPIDTSDWKIFRNEYANFEIKYPPELIEIFPGSPNLKLPEQDASDPHAPFSFLASDVIPIPYLDEKGEKHWNTKPDPCDIPEIIEGCIEKRMIGGVSFTRIEEKVGFPDDVDISYIGNHGKWCYRFRYHITHGTIPNHPAGVITRAYISLFDDIVSTFQLLTKE